MNALNGLTEFSMQPTPETARDADILRELNALLESYGVGPLTKADNTSAERLSLALGQHSELTEAVGSSTELTELIGKILGGAAGWMLGGPLGAVAGTAAAHYGGKLWRWAKGKHAKAKLQAAKKDYKTRRRYAKAAYLKNKQFDPSEFEKPSSGAETKQSQIHQNLQRDDQMKTIEERMAALLNPEQAQPELTEQMLEETVGSANTILEANGIELQAEDLSGYIEGLKEVLEGYELALEDREALTEIFNALTRMAGHVARGIGATVGTYKRAKAAVGRAKAHIAGSYDVGHEAGQHTAAATPDEFTKQKEKKPSFLSKAFAGDPAKKAAAKATADAARLKAKQGIQAAQQAKKLAAGGTIAPA